MDSSHNRWSSISKRLNSGPNILSAFVLATTCMFSGCTGMNVDNTSANNSKNTSATHKQAPVVEDVAKSMEEEWGVRVLGISWSAAGYMLDFRYRVLDPEKAASLLNRRITPYLIVAKTGTKLAIPTSEKIGALRQSSEKVYPNRNYFMLFGNPGRMVKVGDKVTVVVGEFKAEQLTVR